ncbi:MFS transporter, partial [Streptomyces sp. H39-C1]|uniref:MFS transporter n=1 Tax=Streptomyces sp. H39-C1 TaxID=3004355 RepID=UPI0022AF218A
MTGTQDRLPLGALLALATAGFLTMLTETVPAGLLPRVGEGLHVSDSAAGQLLTIYAAGSVVAAIPLTALMRGLPRRPVLVSTVLVVAVVNLLTAFSSSYELTLAVRAVGGMVLPDAENADEGGVHGADEPGRRRPAGAVPAGRSSVRCRFRRQ